MTEQNKACELSAAGLAKSLLAGALLALPGLAGLSAANAQEGPPATAEFYSGPPEIVLYDGPNFSGRSLTLNADAPDLARQRFNDTAGSIRVISGSWRLCEDSNERGYCAEIDQDVRQLSRLNNRISSVTQALRGPGGGPRPGGGGDSITFYSGSNFTGRSITLNSAEPDFSRIRFNDQARSVRYSGQGSWRACQHSNYGGACFEITGDIRDLATARMSAQISSAAPDRGFGGGYGPGTGYGQGPRSGIWLYDGQNFGGQRIELNRDLYDFANIRFNDRADSLRVAPGEVWELCQDSYGRGRCEIFRGGEYGSLYQFGLANAVSSAARIYDSGGYRGRDRGGYGRWRIEGGLEGITTTFYPVAEYGGMAIDRCLYPGGGDCDTVAADAICQASGHREAAYFTVDRGRRYRTVHFGTGQTCQTGRCEAILDVLCID